MLLVLWIFLLLFLLHLSTNSNRSIREAETSGASLSGMAAWGLAKETEGRDSFTFPLILKFSSSSITTSSQRKNFQPISYFFCSFFLSFFLFLSAGSLMCSNLHFDHYIFLLAILSSRKSNQLIE